MQSEAGFFLSVEASSDEAAKAMSKALAARLSTLGHKVTVVSEVAGTPLGRQLNAIVQNAAQSLDPTSLSLLTTAGRRQLILADIRPALSRGDIVICERFIHSALALVSTTAEVTADVALALHAQACDDLWPDLTLLLDETPNAARQIASRLRTGDAASVLRRTMIYTPDGDYGIIDAPSSPTEAIERAVRMITRNDRFEDYSDQRSRIAQPRAA